MLDDIEIAMVWVSVGSKDLQPRMSQSPLLSALVGLFVDVKGEYTMEVPFLRPLEEHTDMC